MVVYGGGVWHTVLMVYGKWHMVVYGGDVVWDGGDGVWCMVMCVFECVCVRYSYVQVVVMALTKAISINKKKKDGKQGRTL